MAWEDLLRLHDRREDGPAAGSGGEGLDKVSLIRQVGAVFGWTGEEERADGEEDGEPVTICYEDGYERRSPVQPYRTAEDYNRRRIRRAIAIVVGLFLAALLVLALVRAGMLRF